MTDRVVLTMKWGDVFPASYVNRLYNAVSANLEKPFKFVCLTNEPEGLHSGILHFPLPDLDIPPEHYSYGAWPKLGVFQQDLYGLKGRCLFIDLDTAITNNIEPFFEHPGEFVAIGGGRDWRHEKIVAKPELLTGVFAFDIGTLPHIFEAFVHDKDRAFSDYVNEQSFVEGHLKDWSAWPAGWVVSFKRHLCRSLLQDVFLRPRDPEPSTKVVAFHGDPRPIDLVGRKSIWTKNFPHFVRCPVDWLDAYWARHQ